MTNTERIADAGETMELGVVVSALRRKYELEKRGRCSKCTATNDMCNICHIGAVKAAAALILSLTERIKELEAELWVSKFLHEGSTKDALINVQGEVIQRLEASKPVECRECKEWEKICGASDGYCYHWDYERGMSPNRTDEDDFCSYGRRKEQNIE